MKEKNKKKKNKGKGKALASYEGRDEPLIARPGSCSMWPRNCWRDLFNSPVALSFQTVFVSGTYSASPVKPLPGYLERATG